VANRCFRVARTVSMITLTPSSVDLPTQFPIYSWGQYSHFLGDSRHPPRNQAFDHLTQATEERYRSPCPNLLQLSQRLARVAQDNDSGSAETRWIVAESHAAGGQLSQGQSCQQSIVCQYY